MTQETGNPDALRAHKVASLKKTRQELELAVRRIVNGNPKMIKKGTILSAASVAKEAGVERSTLYRYHEPVLTDIRRINDATPQKKLKEKHSELADAKGRSKEYREMLEDEQANLAQMARQNYALNQRIKELEAIARTHTQLIEELQRPSGNVSSIVNRN